MNRSLKANVSQKQRIQKRPMALKSVYSQKGPHQTGPDNRIGLPVQTASMVAQLTSSHFQTAQRQTMVRQLNQTQGNRYVQRLMGQIQRWTDPEAAAQVIDIIDTANSAPLKTLVDSFDTGVNGQGVNLKLPDGTSVTIPIEDATKLRARATDKLAERLMEDVADIVLPLAAGIDAATSNSQRRKSMIAIYDQTASSLDRIAVLRPGSERWKHPNPAVQDAILAVLKLKIIFSAEAYFSSPIDQEAKGGAHYEARTTMGGRKDSDWCGMFASTNYLQSNFDDDLKKGFLHVDNVVDYFTYVYRRTHRVKQWIYVDDQWQDLRAYHESRSSLRQWTDASSVTSAEGLDIQAGDIVLMDHDRNGKPNHIVIAHAWNPTTKMLFTIGGNDSGFQIDQSPADSGPTAGDETTMNDREQAEQALNQPLRKGDKEKHVGVRAIDVTKGKIFGVGRPSIVDFEDHTYHTENPKKPPVDVPGI